MNPRAVLAAFDEQMRKNARGDAVARVEREGPVVRHVAADPEGFSAVLWAEIDEASADATIAEQVRYFAGLKQPFEWKHYGHDRPADLPERLARAGFEPQPEESLMVAEVASLDVGAPPPPGVSLLRAGDPAGVELVVRAHEGAFGTDHAWLREALVAQLERAPDGVAAFVAMAGDLPVCSGRIEFHEGTDFASLWGGGTLPPFRGRGVYRSLVARRAHLAAERGFRYLQVDASPDSRPILERLGFARLTSTTPYLMRPRGA